MARRKPGEITVGQLLPIVFTLLALVAVIALKSRCGSAAGDLFKAIGEPPSKSARPDAGRP
jgi:hypothetical protein